MMSQMKKYFSIILLWALSISAFGQAKVYTKSAKLSDFPQKVSKIVLSDRPALDAALRSEITSLWKVSAYEFCTQAEYNELKNSNLYYFLSLVADGDFTYMKLSKGGAEKDADPMKEGLDIVEFPIGPDGTDYSITIEYMGLFVDMAQNYISKAVDSEKAAYGGIKTICKRQRPGDKIEEITILPAAGGWGTNCYKIKFNPDTHDLYQIKKKRISK